MNVMIATIVDTLLAGDYQYNGLRRAQFIFDSPNEFGCALAFVFGIAVSLSIASEGRLTKKNRIDTVVRCSSTVLVLILFWLLLRTMSRGGVVAALSAFSAVAVLRRSFGWNFAGILIGCILLFCSNHYASERILSTGVGDMSSLNRLTLWRNMLRTAAAGELSEFGYDNVQWTWFQEEGRDLHYRNGVSDFFTELAEHGPLVMSVYICSLFILCWSAIRIVAMDRWFSHGASGLISLSVGGLFSYTHGSTTLNCLWTVGVLSTVVGVVIAFKKDHLRLRFIKVGLVVGMVSAVIFVGGGIAYGSVYNIGHFPISCRRIKFVHGTIPVIQIGTNSNPTIIWVVEPDDIPLLGRWVCRELYRHNLTQTIFVVPSRDNLDGLLDEILRSDYVVGNLGITPLIAATRGAGSNVASLIASKDRNSREWLWTDGVDRRWSIGANSLSTIGSGHPSARWVQVMERVEEIPGITESLGQNERIEIIEADRWAVRGPRLVKSILSVYGELSKDCAANMKYTASKIK